DESPAFELEHRLPGRGAAGLLRLGEVGLGEQFAGFESPFDDLAGGPGGHPRGDRGGVVGELPRKRQQFIHTTTIADAYIDRCISSSADLTIRLRMSQLIRSVSPRRHRGTAPRCDRRHRRFSTERGGRRVALKELRRSGRTLNLVHVITPAGPESAAESELRSAGDEVLTRLSVRLAHLDAAHPDAASDTTIDTEVVIGDPAEALSALASDASLLVLGHHGVGQGNSPRLGTVSFGLPGHALSSVLVHRVRTGSEFDDPAAHPTMRSGPGLPPT